MRHKNEILYGCKNTDNWRDPDQSRKAHQLDIMIEVLIDIRDQIDALNSFLLSFEKIDRTVT